MGAKLLNTKGRACWNGITIVAAGEVIGRIQTLELADPEELDRIAKIVNMPLRFSMGCAVSKAKCEICGEEWDDEAAEHCREE